MKKILIFLSIISIIIFIIFLNCQQPVEEKKDDKKEEKKDKPVPYSAVGLYDTTFNNGGSGANNSVYATAIQSDGKILIGGLFTNYNGTLPDVVPDYIIRLNTNGTHDTAFNSGAGNTGPDNIVHAIAVQSADGKILIGGDFTTYNGVAEVPDGIIRLNTDGTYDNTFNGGNPGIDVSVRAMAIQSSDGKILIGGWFTTYNGIDRPDMIIRLNAADGTYDTAFNSGAGNTGADNVVSTIAIQSDGKILIGGNFTTYNGADVPDRIIRLNTDGTYDNTFNSGAGNTGADAQVGSIAIQSDGKILIGGIFTTYNGANVPDRIIRLNADGTYDNTFNTGGTGASNKVSAIAIQSNQKILIAGNIFNYNGVNVPNLPYNIIRLNTDGTYDTTFNNGGNGSDSELISLAIQSDGKILIGGAIMNYNLSNVPDGIIRLY